MYLNEFIRLRRDGVLSSELPIVSTIDGSQGKKTNMVFFESVVTEGNSKRDLGFLMDKRWMNEACTRAREILLIVGNEQGLVFRGNINENWTEHRRGSLWLDRWVDPTPLPYLIAYSQWIWSSGAWVSK